MKVLHTEASLNWGGKQLRILEQVQWLNERGHQAWIAARPGSKILEHAARKGLPRFTATFRGKGDVVTVGRLYGLLRKHRIDVVDCHGSRDATSCASLHMLGAPVIRSLHLDAVKDRFSQRLLWRYGSDRIIAVSSALKQRLLRIGVADDRIDVINEGIDFAEFDCRRTGEKIRAEFGIPASSKVLVSIGMIRPDKGQRYLVDAAAAIVAALGDDVRFVLVGDATRADYGREMKARVDASPCRKHFIFTGYRHDVADFIAAADCVVVSSLTEAHSRIVPQAFAMKRPVVATSVGGLPEFVQPRVTGVLVQPADSASLAAGVIHSFQSDNTAMLENAYAMAQQKFRIDFMMQRTIESYAASISRH